MQHSKRWMIMVLIIASLYLAACGQSPAAPATEETGPVTIERLQGKEPTRETLTEEAAKRLDIQTAAVRDMESAGTQQKVVPYAAILYDTNGATWVYLNTEPLTFLRYPVTVKDIQGDQALLSDGPPSGSAVVTVGATELYGAEFEFEEE